MVLKYTKEQINNALEEHNDWNPYVGIMDDFLLDTISFIEKETNIPFNTIQRILELHYGIYLLELHDVEEDIL